MAKPLPAGWIRPWCCILLTIECISGITVAKRRVFVRVYHNKLYLVGNRVCISGITVVKRRVFVRVYHNKRCTLLAIESP